MSSEHLVLLSAATHLRVQDGASLRSLTAGLQDGARGSHGSEGGWAGGTCTELVSAASMEGAAFISTEKQALLS